MLCMSVCRVLDGQQVWVAMPLGVATAIALQESLSMQLPSGQGCNVAYTGPHLRT